MNGFNFPPPPDEPVPVVSRDIRAKRIVPSPRKAPTVRSGKGSIFGKASIPSVYWAGDDPTPLADEEHTFYREGTPPPDEKGAAAAARKRGLSLYDEERRARRERRDRKCCGLRMWVFWLLVGLLVLVVLGVGVGVGVGVGAGSKASQADGSAARTSSATPTPRSSVSAGSSASGTTVASPTASPTTISSSASTTLATSTRASSTKASTPTATSGPTALCPDADNTFYSPTGSDKKFLRVCGIDFTGNEAIDMSNLLTSSMGECMDVCSKTAQCTGAGWGNVTTGEGTMELRCWLKRDLKSSHNAKAGWNFAILQ
ncbi:hypothetical protein CkaCkLH20_08598 [Colletotrichum karsti]|uniref:Apple domain-containing protein n=1 Tax=Colletotrichum karsti TaxID=1095194 RepID=A0A9P6I0K5_9PEZI|nr:uncharacterized protein CkaCkLH20_08598 [Colletotrichum karsti]KAF9873864.1 hypothetical protein CkaCkLH20_08598 [Colletotrichum karsti]